MNVRVQEKQQALQLGENKGIYAQLDNFTCMFYSSTIEEVFQWLKVDVSKYYGDMYRDKKMFSNMCAYQFQWNGINVQAQNVSCITMMQVIEKNNEINEDYSPDEEDFVDVFTFTLNAIRLELTGTGLQYMREYVDPNIDIYLRDRTKKPMNMKVTRCDFAYDFINYMPDVLDAIIDYAQSYCTKTGRVLTYKGRGYKCEVHTVGQKKVYLGSPQSEKMLRIYDKRLEQLDRNREVYAKPNKYGNPDSWIRFEFQCRNDVAHQLVYGKSLSPDCYIQPDLFSIFKKLMGDYTFIDPETTSQNRRPYQLWLDMWDWNELDELYKMQNVQEDDVLEQFELPEDKCVRFIKTIMPIIIAFLDRFGLSFFFSLIYDYLESLENPDDEFARRKKARLSMRLAQLDTKEHKLLSVKNSRYFLSDKIKNFFTI